MYEIVNRKRELITLKLAPQEEGGEATKLYLQPKEVRAVDEGVAKHPEVKKYEDKGVLLVRVVAPAAPKAKQAPAKPAEKQGEE